jgi:hypothetical protein
MAGRQEPVREYLRFVNTDLKDRGSVLQMYPDGEAVWAELEDTRLNGPVNGDPWMDLVSLQAGLRAFLEELAAGKVRGDRIPWLNVALSAEFTGFAALDTWVRYERGTFREETEQIPGSWRSSLNPRLWLGKLELRDDLKAAVPFGRCAYCNERRFFIRKPPNRKRCDWCPKAAVLRAWRDQNPAAVARHARDARAALREKDAALTALLRRRAG